MSVGAAVMLTACASAPKIGAQWPELRSSELVATPFFPQQEFQCGPAALATVLKSSGVDTTPQQLAPQVFIPGRKGSLQLELVAAARRHDRIPYVLKPEIDAIFREVEGGTPVLVLQNLGVSWLPVWHYAVVIGLDTATDEVILRSGTDERRLMSFRHFRNSWERGGRWAMLAQPAERTPATAEPVGWLGAAVSFEKLGKPEVAIAAYKSAAERWPASALVWQVLGTAEYGRGEYRLAQAAFRHAAEIAPGAATLNNLAQTQLDLGCAAQAAATLEQADRLPADAATSEALKQTAAAVSAAGNADKSETCTGL